MTQISKYLSYILRHQPESINLKLDDNGWADIDELINKTKDLKLTREIIYKVVKISDKQRFIIKDNKIRANQGHSINIDLALELSKPPKILYHGTAEKNIESIFKEGIKSLNRQYVHLSQDIETAKKVASRHGKPVILEIDCKKMYEDAHKFYLSENNVWLTEYISANYIRNKGDRHLF